MDERMLLWAVETLERLLDNALLRRLRVGKYTPTIDEIHDEDDMASDSATGLATQQSIKAYVDAIAAALDHGNLNGLSDDDHAQYLLISGTRAMSGDLDMDGNGIVDADALDIDQTADLVAININGYDDQAANSLDLFVGSAGDGGIRADKGLYISAQDGYARLSAIVSDVQLKVGDNAGTHKVQVLDSDGAEVASINSDGHATLESMDVKRTIQIALLDNDTSLATGDDFPSFYWCVPEELNGYNITSVHFWVTTASTSGTPEFQVYNVTDSVDILSTTCTIDANEYTSYTATTAHVVNASNDELATGDLIRFDCDTAGTGTAGCGVIITAEKP